MSTRARNKKKFLRVVDRRAVGGGMVRELRGVLRGIESGDIVSMAFVFVRRDGSLRTQFDCECAVKALGNVEILKDYIKEKKFELM